MPSTGPVLRVWLASRIDQRGKCAKNSPQHAILFTLSRIIETCLYYPSCRGRLHRSLLSGNSLWRKETSSIWSGGFRAQRKGGEGDRNREQGIQGRRMGYNLFPRNKKGLRVQKELCHRVGNTDEQPSFSAN